MGEVDMSRTKLNSPVPTKPGYQVWGHEVSDKGICAKVEFHVCGERTRVLRSTWRHDSNRDRAIYFGSIELRARLREECNARSKLRFSARQRAELVERALAEIAGAKRLASP